MIIEFPKKYSVKRSPAKGCFAFNVYVPKDREAEVFALFQQQPWVSSALSLPGNTGEMWVSVSLAYEITEAQAIDALSRLCEHIIAPPVEMDTDLAGELEALV